MYRKIISKLKDKNIAILGFGREGKSTYNFIRKYLPEIKLTILDKYSVDIEDNYVNKIVGDNYLDNLDIYDLIIKSPGISLKDIDIGQFRNKITSQLELLLEVFRNNIIGITGTKGKSTTSSLMYEVIKKQRDNVFLIGNIGVPVFNDIESYNEESILVVEMSSHQLEFVKYSPHIGIILNLYEDHLDHDGTLEKYHSNKLNIFKYQNNSDFAIYSDDNNYLNKYMKNSLYKGIKYTVRFDYEDVSFNSVRIKENSIYIDGEVVYVDKERMLLGDANLKNIMFVLAICKILNLDFSLAGEVISKFKGLKYRMEYVGKYKGINFYSDTIATIPEATMNDVKSIDNIDTLIIGGLDRGINYEEFIDFLNKSNIRNIICMPETGNYIGKRIINKNIYYADTLEDAVNIGINNTHKAKCCLLSPAAASYNQFKNFEEKGQAFVEILKKYKK